MSDYPTEDQLKKITNFPVTKENFHEFMDSVKEIWWMPSWGWDKEGDTYRISTGGWSGNEDLIMAMVENHMFWIMFWKQSRVGGHYIFSSESDWEKWDKTEKMRVALSKIVARKSDDTYSLPIDADLMVNIAEEGLK